MKILFLHYAFKSDGVTRCVLNNINGLKELSENISFVLAGNCFASSIPSDIEKRHIDWNSQDIVSQIHEIAKDADIIVVENPSVGILPQATLAFKEYAEKNKDKKIIYRVHDLIDDRPHLFENFKKTFDNFDDIYPVSSNVSFLTLTSFDKARLIKKGLNNVEVLPNSIVVSDLDINREKSFGLRTLFEKKGIVKPGEKILAYPVRIEKRKNMEEAMLLTKILNEGGENYRLVITLPFGEDYKKELEILADKHKIPCSIGKASEYISFDKKDEFTIADFYAASDLVISTSVREGFGFVFVEPWLAGTSIIGRAIPSVTEDFQTNGIDLSYLYGNDIFPCSDDPKERMKKIDEILSDPDKLNKISEILDIKSRISKAVSLINQNKEAIKKHYNHMNIAKQFLENIKS
ncbi:glycosyltransferase family 4 protein [Candidatus Pacearchaeota archaeon]|nr:glycosyltransferase family 4 protein [Candidatus Pacearchaeota archaeon]